MIISALFNIFFLKIILFLFYFFFTLRFLECITLIQETSSVSVEWKLQMCFAMFLLRSIHADNSAIHPYNDGQCFSSSGLSEKLLTSHLINHYFQSRSLTFLSCDKNLFCCHCFYFLVHKHKAAIPCIPVACMSQHQENQVDFFGSPKSLPPLN